MKRLALVAAAAVATIGACNDEGGDRLSADEFEERGNEICLRYRKAIADDIAALGPGQPTAQEAQRLTIDAVIPAQKTQVEDLRELVPPADIAGEYDSLLAETQDAVATLLEWAEEDPTRLLDDDPFPEFDDRAAELGLSACGSS